MLLLENIKDELKLLQDQALQDIELIKNSKNLSEFRIKYLGDKSRLSNLRRQMKEISPELRPEFGKILNQISQFITELFEQTKTKIEEEELNIQLSSEALDMSLPGLDTLYGALHPLTLVTREIAGIFESMGFVQMDGPEIESTYYNFTALNTPEDHPARDEQDTFYIKGNPDKLLRSHTSSIQIKAMEKLKPPFAIFGHGRVYRNEEVNARKMPFFHQLEIMMVDKDIHFGNMKWVLEEFIQRFFAQDVKSRLRPDFFPFTEPSAELDLECLFCKGQGCQTCGFRSWIELMGCGMIDPNVLEMAGIDSSIYSGFAAGLGLDRFTMLKYKINDIRLMFSGDQRFVKQFR